MGRRIPKKGFRLDGKHLEAIKNYFENPDFYDPEFGCDSGTAYQDMILAIFPVFKVCMNEQDLDRVVYDAILGFETANAFWEKTGDGCSARASYLQGIITTVVDVLSTYPRDYEFRIPLPAFVGLPEGEYKLDDNLSLIIKKVAGNPPAIVFKARGFWMGSGESEDAIELISKMKIFAFITYLSHGNWIGLRHRDTEASVIDLTTGESRQLPLADGVARLLGKISLSPAGLLNLAGKPLNGRGDMGAAMEFFCERAGTYFKALRLSENQRLATAIEWYEDARVVSNQTVALLEVCIGLEALLGDDEDMPEMTKRLCDRFAFTLGKTPVDRKALYNDYKELLYLRGRVVHSKIARLDENGRKILERGFDMLRRMIEHELQQII